MSTFRPVGTILVARNSQDLEEGVDGDASEMSHYRFALALVEGVMDLLDICALEARIG